MSKTRLNLGNAALLRNERSHHAIALKKTPTGITVRFDQQVRSYSATISSFHGASMESNEHGDKFQHGIGLFNNRRFFDAHETWEEIWLQSVEPDKAFLQGIIQ